MAAPLPRPPGRIDLTRPVNWDHPLNRGLVAWWLPLPGRLGNTLYDIAGRTHGTLTNGPTWAAGPNGFAAVNTSGGSHVAAPDWTNLAAGDFAVAVAHTPTTWGGTGFCALFDKGTSGPNRQMSIFFDGSGNVSYHGIGCQPSPTGFPATGMTAGRPWHFVLSRTGSTCTCYVNGASKGTFTEASTTAGPGGTWQFGGNPSGGGGTYSGTYHHVAYYRRGLSASEPGGLYEQWVRGHPDTLRRWSPRAWGFGADSGGTVADGAGSASFSLAAAGVGASTAAAAGSGSLALSAAGTGASTAAGAGVVSVSLAPAAVGASTFAAAGSASLTLTGSGAGASEAAVAGAASVGLTVAGTGASAVVAAGAASLSLSAAGAGSSLAAAAGSAAFTLTAAGGGASVAEAVGTAGLTLSAAGTGASTTAATGSVAFTIVAAAVSGSPVVLPDRWTVRLSPPLAVAAGRESVARCRVGTRRPRVTRLPNGFALDYPTAF